MGCGHPGHKEGDCVEVTSYVAIIKVEGIYAAVLMLGEQKTPLATISAKLLPSDDAVKAWGDDISTKWLQFVKANDDRTHNFSVEAWGPGKGPLVEGKKT